MLPIEADESELLPVTDWTELRVQAFQVSMDLEDLPASLASFEGEERGAVILTFQDPSGLSYHADVGDAIVA